MRLTFSIFLILFFCSFIPAQSCRPLSLVIEEVNQEIDRVLIREGIDGSAVNRDWASPPVYQTLTNEMQRFGDRRSDFWATFGLRRLDFGKAGRGRVSHAESQVHLIAVPASQEKIKIDIREVSGKGKTGYVICKIDHRGVYTKLKSGWFNEISSQKSNTAETRSHTLSNVKDYLISIRFEGRSTGSSFDYEVLLRQVRE